MLENEILFGPIAAELKTLASVNNIAGIYDALHRKDIPIHQPIPASIFKVWLAQTDQRSVVEDTAKNVGDPMRSLALTLLDTIQSNLSLDMSDPHVYQLAEVWYNANKCDITTYQSLLALSNIMTSRAELIGFTGTIGDIAELINQEYFKKLL